MITNILYRILKYTAIGLAIYLIFRFVPNTKLSDCENILISLLSVFVLILLETTCGFLEKDKDKDIEQQKLMCSSVCSAKEPTREPIKEPIRESFESSSSSSEEEKKAEETNNQEEEKEEKEDEEEEEEEENQEGKTDKKKNNSKKGDIPDYDSIVKKMDEEQKGYEVNNKMGKTNEERLKEYLKSKGVTSEGSRNKDDIIRDERKYNQFTINNVSCHQIPLPDNYDKDSFEYGDSFLPPEKWYPTPPIPPVCVSEKRANICPVLTTGAPVNLKDWHSSTRITPPDQINTKYINEKLNSGR